MSMPPSAPFGLLILLVFPIIGSLAFLLVNVRNVKQKAG